LVHVVSWFSHVEATGETQLHGEGQVSHYNSQQVLCFQLHAELEVSSVAKKDKNILQTISDLLLCYGISLDLHMPYMDSAVPELKKKNVREWHHHVTGVLIPFD
jgi:hypothetical protein